MPNNGHTLRSTGTCTAITEKMQLIISLIMMVNNEVKYEVKREKLGKEKRIRNEECFPQTKKSIYVALPLVYVQALRKRKIIVVYGRSNSFNIL